MYLHFHPSFLDYLHLTPPTWSITTIALKLCSTLFTLLDIENNSRLEEYQIRALLIHLTNLNESHLSTLFFKLDLDRSGAIELEEFFLLISLLLANKDKKEKEFMHAHSKTVFELLDEDSSNTISVDEFQSLGFLFNLAKRDIRTIFHDFDVSGDDALNYGEFRMFTLACINNQTSAEKKRFKYLIQRRLNFLAKQRRSTIDFINKTIRRFLPDVTIFDLNEIFPRLILPMNLKIPCEKREKTDLTLIRRSDDDLFHSISFSSTNESRSLLEMFSVT